MASSEAPHFSRKAFKVCSLVCKMDQQNRPHDRLGIGFQQYIIIIIVIIIVIIIITIIIIIIIHYIVITLKVHFKVYCLYYP